MKLKDLKYGVLFLPLELKEWIKKEDVTKVVKIVSELWPICHFEHKQIFFNKAI